MLLSILCQIQNINGLGDYKTSFNFDIFIRSQDSYITPIYCLIIIGIASLYANQHYHNQLIKKYFLPGLLVKLMGAICVGLVYQFYYKGAGDTSVYYGDGKVIGDLAVSNLSLFMKVLGAKGGLTDADNILSQVGVLQYYHDHSAFLIDKIVAIIGLFTFQTYTTIAVVMATISFTGAWALYLTFCKIYPNLYKQFAIAILFIPSVFFWGSGILKDCVTFGCLGWFTYASYNIFFLKRKIIYNALLFIISGYLILQIKAYIILSFLPSLVFWFFLTYRSKIKNVFYRNLITPLIILFMATGGYLIIQRLGQEATGYSLNNFVKTASSFQAWHGYLAETTGASGYSLGIITPTALGALEKFPAAVNVTLFRPYLWEAHNPVVFLAAIESFIISIFTIRIFLRTGIIRTVKIIFQTPIITFCIFFSMLFAFAVGFTAYNFGALDRFKIPCIPFYVCALFILDYVTQQETSKRKRFSKVTLIRPKTITIK
jgi:hypothetical protein